MVVTSFRPVEQANASRRERNKEIRQGFTNATEGFFILTAGHSCILHITSKYITVHIPIYHYKPWFTEQIHPLKHSHFKN